MSNYTDIEILIKDLCKKSMRFQIVAATQFRSIIDKALSSNNPEDIAKFTKLLLSTFLGMVSKNTQEIDIKKSLLIILGYVAYHDRIFTDESFETLWYALKGNLVSKKFPVCDLQNDYLKILNLLQESTCEFNELKSKNNANLNKYQHIIDKMPNEFYDKLISVVDDILYKISGSQGAESASNVDIVHNNDNLRFKESQFDNYNDEFVNTSEQEALMSHVNEENVNALKIGKCSIDKFRIRHSLIYNRRGVKDFDGSLNSLSEEQFKILISNQNGDIARNKVYEELFKYRIKDKYKMNEQLKERIKDRMNEQLKERMKDKIVERLKERIWMNELFEERVKDKDKIVELLEERVKDKDKIVEQLVERVKDKGKENELLEERVKDKDKIVEQLEERVKDKDKENELLEERIKYKDKMVEQLEDHVHKPKESSQYLLKYFVSTLYSVEDDIKKLKADMNKSNAMNKKIKVLLSKNEPIEEGSEMNTSDKIVMNKTKLYVEYIWQINDFDSLKSGPMEMRESDHFYTSECGYKMCLRIYANGNGEEGYGTHLSVFYAVTKGDYDDTLDWPFNGVVTLTLLDKTKTIFKKHFYKRFSKCEYSECYKQPSEEYNEAYGDRTFCPLKELSPGSRYLSDGSITLKMSIVMK